VTQHLVAVPIVSGCMTCEPISVTVDTSFHDIAAALSRNKISAVPVTDEDGRAVGCVSELDLVRPSLREQRDLGDLTARDLMTAPLATVAPDVPVTAAARLLADAGVRRLFVVDDGRVVGVLSRRDLLRGYLRDDPDIGAQVEQTVRAAFPDSHTIVRASVADGVVTLVGCVARASALVGVDRLVRAIPGVVEVRNRIGFQWDDRGSGRHRR